MDYCITKCYDSSHEFPIRIDSTCGNLSEGTSEAIYFNIESGLLKYEIYNSSDNHVFTNYFQLKLGELISSKYHVPKIFEYSPNTDATFYLFVNKNDVNNVLQDILNFKQHIIIENKRHYKYWNYRYLYSVFDGETLKDFQRFSKTYKNIFTEIEKTEFTVNIHTEEMNKIFYPRTEFSQLLKINNDKYTGLLEIIYKTVYNNKSFVNETITIKLENADNLSAISIYYYLDTFRKCFDSENIKIKLLSFDTVEISSENNALFELFYKYSIENKLSLMIKNYKQKTFYERIDETARNIPTEEINEEIC